MRQMMQDTMTAGYTSNATYEQLGERIAKASNVALVSHYKADGDSIGSMLAIARAVLSRRQRAHVLLTGPVDENPLALVGDTPHARVELLPNSRPSDDYDLIVVVDTGAWSQLETVAGWLRDHRDIVIGIDHHSHGDDVASLRVIDSTRASPTSPSMRISSPERSHLRPSTAGWWARCSWRATAVSA
jgi:nanoRNase/pAp phosphatase (c-di-AMP/oligoRNAs hydrolase)